jgi:poly(A) polymerase
MPIITPAYPSMCSTYNITRSSLTIIKRELGVASELSNQIVSGRRPWKDLFAKHSFFTTDFKYYIMVVSTSTDKESHNLWSGFIESKVRVLVQNLERHPSIALARPFTKGYERTHRFKDSAELDEIGTGSVKYVTKDTVPSETTVTVEVAGAGVKVETSPAKAESEDNADSAVKMEGVLANDGSREVFTATHYIGVELANSKF